MNVADTADNDRTASEMTGGRMRGMGGGAETRTQAHLSKDKASAHGTPALPTELMGAPDTADLRQRGKKSIRSSRSDIQLLQMDRQIDG